MKKSMFCICMVMVFMPLSGLYAQAPGIEWENTIKGSNPDYIKGMSTTTDY